ncbi:MAG: O-antigen ligase family protein, partial [Planctomycetia bacterium]|nr:O-antigen ligase family protein [Planctomycetia bacterium]
MKPAQNEPSGQQPAATAHRATPRQSVLERIVTGLLSAVFVCRLLTPTDAAATGETLWIAQFALLAFLVWAFTVWRAGELRLAFDGLDIAVSLVCLGHVVGALVVVATSGDKRAAMTMLWEWVGLWITFFLMRRLACSADRQGLLLVFASTALVLAGLGVWQHHFGFDESRRAYEELKARLAALERSGRPTDPAAALDWDRSLSSVRSDFVQMNIPADDSARMLWEQRLYSVEPIGLFALANTLGGVLVVAAIVWLGGLISSGRFPGRPIIAVGAILTLLIVYCLLLTKSRTAWVGMAVGLAAWGMALGRARFESIRRFRRYLAAGTGAVAVLIAVAFASGGLDRLVVSESMKSLRYRFQYWTGTCRMLFNSPQSALLGVGPGNFRQHYLEFKLPESSEEIADPHNLVLDVWANGGLIAVAGLAGIGFLVIRALLRGHQEDPRRRDGGAAHDQAAGASASEKLWADGIVLGGAGAFLIALFLGLADEVSLLFMLAAWLVSVYVCGPIFRRDLPRVVPAAACVALIV